MSDKVGMLTDDQDWVQAVEDVSKIQDLESRLTESQRKVEELEKSIDLRWNPTVRNLREENTKLRALLGEAVRILDMATLNVYESNRLKELKDKLQEVTK